MKFIYKGKSFALKGVSKSDHIYNKIVSKQSFYELDLLDFIQNLVRFFDISYENSIVIDVGANIGNHSVFFGSFVSKNVISVEPNPEVIEVLRGNLAANLKAYTLFNVGAGSVAGRAAIDLPENAKGNIGATRLSQDKSKGDGIIISTLDSIYESWSEDNDSNYLVSIVKIDVEGMELDVLKGANRLLDEHRPFLFVEAATREEKHTIKEYMKKYRYSRLPGRWATTPVYCFAHRPDIKLIFFSFFMMCRRWFKRKILGMFRTY